MTRNFCNDYTLNATNFNKIYGIIVGIFSTTFLSTLIVLSFVFEFSLAGLFYVSIYEILVCFCSVALSILALEKLSQVHSPVNKWSAKLASVDTKKQIPIQISLDEKNYDVKNYIEWFNKISDNQDFYIECKDVLREINKAFGKVALRLDCVPLIYEIGNVYLKHVKEFKRSLKRKEKYNMGISNLFSYSHISMKSLKSRTYFIHQLTTNLLSHFVNWELWHSLPCQVLVSMISNRFSVLLLRNISRPEVLNYHLLKACSTKQFQEKVELSRYNKVKISDFELELENSEGIDVADQTKLDTLLLKGNRKVQTRTQPTVNSDTKNSSSRDECDFLGTNTEVKIYEPRSANKKWKNIIDCNTTMGEDPLSDFKIIGEKSDHLWTDSPDNLEEEESPVISTKTLFNEVKQIKSIESLKTSIKPLGTATVTSIQKEIKDFHENTVNNVVKPVSQVTSSALHKFGDLQDEAAGVVEGLFDFGMAGIRKGLKLTGLQELNCEEGIAVDGKTKSDDTTNKMQKRSSSKKSVESEFSIGDNVWINPLQSTSLPDSVPMSDFEEFNGVKVNELNVIPSLLTDTTPCTDSPDPEYEETADLATTIAKLRSLLQQKYSESTTTTPMVSPMPNDDMSSKVSLESDGIDEVDGVVPSFYKFCAKTATGVFTNTLNTIKTALPANVNDRSHTYSFRWSYDGHLGNKSSLQERMDQLLSERKAYCNIDPAYEALDTFQVGDQNDEESFIPIRDDFDDFELNIPLTKILVDLFCELLAQSNTILIQEPLIKALLLIGGIKIENGITSKIEEIVNKPFDFNLDSNETEGTFTMTADEFVNCILPSVPDYLKTLIGESILQRGLYTLLQSLQAQKVNQDLSLQIFELICFKLIEESSKLSPPASA